MTSPSLLQEYKPYYNLIAAVINSAVKEFNKGTAVQRQQAAAFFRDEYNGWIWEAVGATVQDVIKHRLDGDPFDLQSLKKPRKAINKSCRPAVRVMFRGRSLTLPEWAAELGIEYKALYARYKRYGSCSKTFKI